MIHIPMFPVCSRDDGGGGCCEDDVPRAEEVSADLRDGRGGHVHHEALPRVQEVKLSAGVQVKHN